MRKLTVKNFSVIREAELEFGKITVLIGPQSSGKSLLCKLAYFLSKEVLILAVDGAIGGATFTEFKSKIVGVFRSRFYADSVSDIPFSVGFVEGNYSIRFSGKYETFDGEIGCDISPQFKELYEVYFRSRPDKELALVSRQDLQNSVWISLNQLLSETDSRESLYIPAGRAYFTVASRGFTATRNPDIDPVVGQFGAEISWDTRWRIGMVVAEDSVLDEIKQAMIQIVKGDVVATNGEPIFLAIDGRRLPLSLLSSGTQELLPLVNVLYRLAAFQEYGEVMRRGLARRAARAGISKDLAGSSQTLVYLEEPEANVFPSTQYELVRLFARMSHEPNLDFSWVITTHSPYILSSFNNLIEAGQVIRDHPELRDEVAKIVPEQYWIKDGDFKAYSIHDGKLESILNESGFVEGNYLDQVSDVIEKEFDELLRLEYDHTEAS